MSGPTEKRPQSLETRRLANIQLAYASKRKIKWSEIRRNARLGVRNEGRCDMDGVEEQQRMDGGETEKVKGGNVI